MPGPDRQERVDELVYQGGKQKPDRVVRPERSSRRSLFRPTKVMIREHDAMTAPKNVGPRPVSARAG